MLYYNKQSRLLTETPVFLVVQRFASHGGEGFHCFIRTYVPVSPLVHPLLTLTPISPQFFLKNLLSHLFSFSFLSLYRFLFSGDPFVYLGFFSIFLVILFSFNGSFCFPIFIKALYLLGFLRSIVFHIVFHIIYMVFHMFSTCFSRCQFDLNQSSQLLIFFNLYPTPVPTPHPLPPISFSSSIEFTIKFTPIYGFTPNTLGDTKAQS